MARCPVCERECLEEELTEFEESNMCYACSEYTEEYGHDWYETRWSMFTHKYYVVDTHPSLTAYERNI